MFPMPEGGTYHAKVNGLYQYYQSKNGNGLASMKNAISKAYQIEIDFAVLTGFAGVRKLITAVGGVTVTMATAYYDPIYWVTSKKQGWGLSAGTHRLDGNNALIFARSRKGDNDFNRARRQQQLVAAAVKQVLAKGTDILPALLSIADGTTTTDLPLLRVLDVYALVKTANLASVQGAVFGPRTYATGAGGTDFTPNIDVCRAWVQKHFPPAKPGAVWPPQG
jgi:LCP family protein required for cell wall assembly